MVVLPNTDTYLPGCVFLNATSGTYFYFDTQSVFEA
ncbi:unnamed protein product [Brassica oleracea var. botrytis]